MAIYLTGDTHGHIDINKLNIENFPEQKNLTKDDYVIILGDFGLVWDKSKRQQLYLDDLSNRNFTTLFVDGNHENFDLLNSFPTEEWKGGLVHKITDSIFHLQRGQVFTIDNKTFFTFGGASSIDALYRIPSISWWAEELPNKKEMDRGLYNLLLYNNKVDYILTHTCSSSTLDIISFREKFYINEYDTANTYLQHIKDTILYEKWFFGHFHVDYEVTNKEVALYKSIIKLT